jgi:hypothetical protein
LATVFGSVVVDIAKLRDYCLSEAHPRGRHKARSFRARLGLTGADADWLRQDSFALDCSNRRGCATLRDVLHHSGTRMMAGIRVLDVVAVTADLPDGSVVRGQVGTVVEALGPGVFEVEFSDDQGSTYAELAVREDQLMVLRYEPSRVA